LSSSSAKHVPLRVHAVLALLQLTFGSWHVVGKYVLGYIHPLVLSELRIFGSVPLLFVASLAMERRAIPIKRDLLILSALGFLGVFANQLLFIFGLQRTTATNASILMPSTPVFTAAIAVLFRIERVSITKIAGIALAVTGSIVMLDVGAVDVAGFAGPSFIGNLMLLANCLCYSGFMVLQRAVLDRVGPLAVVAWSYLLGGIGIVIVGTPTLVSSDFSTVPSLVWWVVAYIVVVPSSLNYALTSWAIKRSSPALVATYNTLQPLSASALAAVFLGEEAGLRELAGFVLIVLGLFVVSRSPHLRSSAASTNPRLGS
jgi:drug/metabolite transporter (DMT)-like permease